MFLKQKVLFLFILLQLIGSLIMIAGFFIWLWPFELLVSFTPQLYIFLACSLLVTTGLVVLLKNFKKNRPILAILGIAWSTSLFILFFSLSTQPPLKIEASESATVTFATFNKYYSNQEGDRYIEYLKNKSIDILALQEVQPFEVANIAKELGYAHTYSTRTFATSGGTSVAILSRLPFKTAETIDIETNHPVARAVIETSKNKDFVVYAVHIPVPSTRFLYAKRNIVMESLTKTLRNESLPVIIGGDFNTTPFSPALRKFNSTLQPKIKPVITEKVPACSWFGYGDAFCVRIDHVYIPKNAKLTDFTIAPYLGSDHRALIAEIELSQ